MAWLAAGFLTFVAAVSAPAGPPAVFTFSRAVGNVAYATQRMWPAPPPMVTRVREVAGAAWYGWIMRRLPGDVASLDTGHFVPFLVEYQDGAAVRAWCDTNLDGDLTDDEPLALSAYPGPEGTRSFLAHLEWDSSGPGGRDVRIERIVRIVMEPAAAVAGPGGAAPGYQSQIVHAMMGPVALKGRTHQALLFDGDGDGFYGRTLMDGLFVDLDDDGHIDIDQMSEGFGSFDLPFTMEDHSYEVVDLDPEGGRLSLRDLGPAEPLPPKPAPGRPAPDFSFEDTDGHRRRLSDFRGRQVLVYFWASWCPACREQAEGLESLYDRRHAEGAAGLEILAISYDTDRKAMESFRRTHHQAWPTSFSGRRLWEDPVGRIYRERGTGMIYLVEPDGILQGAYWRIEALEAALVAAPGRSAGEVRHSPAATKPPQ